MNPLPAGNTFAPYGPSHWTILGVVLVGALLLVWWGRRSGGVAFARGFACVLGVFALAMQVYRLLPSQWNIGDSLPLHLSDLAWIVAVYALWSRRRWACSLTYYWGLTLNTQAMLTPALDSPGFPHVDFLDFWVQHTLVLWAAIYLTWGLGIRPDWRSYATTASATVAWVLVILGFNTLAGTNYGFLNAKPANPSLLDLLGPWPWYLGVELAVGLAAWALITWPWTRTARSTAAGGGALTQRWR
ncbi:MULTISPECIES: TIGR02206 family membrane protein [unclassified Actinopolyspora]|uniref:TMEM164-related integral membrane acyltransferase n=1 Tax=unclassified Actinopolyspora TaxID=2639451 RepID=UPI0013F59EE9|nr:TIGR02206 family membrane protein [Actinopolyspora sp. BKK2]NHE75473.1 TIGR02206 family membrane protein [Actinopolyspora sp. BKK1]